MTGDGAAGTPPRIDSPHNARVHAVRRLADRRERARTGRFLIEGERVLREAAAAALPLDTLFFTEAFAARPERRSLLGPRAARERFLVSERVMASMAGTAAPQGVLAVAAAPPAPRGDLRAEPGTLVLLVDGVADPGNLGAVLRSAEAFGARAFWTGVGGVDAYHPRAVRAAAGALFRLPPREVPDLAAVGRDLQASGFTVWSLVPRGGVPVQAADLAGAVALAVGGEARGLAPPLRDVGRALTIPMPGGAESLNLAAAAAVACYEAMRQAGAPRS